MEAIGLDFQHGKAALRGAVGIEAEDAVDAAEPVGVHQRGRREAMIGRAVGQ